MNQPLTLIITIAVALIACHATENIRLTCAPALALKEPRSPVQGATMLSGLESKGIKLHPARYWNAVK